MRYGCALAALLLAGAAFPQQRDRGYTSYSYDANGRRVAAGSSSRRAGIGITTHTERRQSLNGRNEPLESVEEKVIEEGPNGRVLERIIQRYEQNGQPGLTEKVRIEERKQPGGGMMVNHTIYRTDINGRFALDERSTTETTPAGDVTNSSTVVERPTLNGSLEVTRRDRSVETKRQDGYVRDVSTFRKGASGDFVEEERQRTELTRQGNLETETTTVYNSTRGKMEFARQLVAETERRPDGSETREVSIYGAAAMGRSVIGSEGAPTLREQRLVEITRGADGSLVERVSVRRASLADANRMEPYRVVSEVVCTGNCIEEEAPAEEEVVVEEPVQQEEQQEAGTEQP